MRFTQSLLLAAVVGFSSCAKGGGSNTEEKDTTNPVITIQSPTNNQAVNAGEIIRVLANGSDNTKLVQLHIHITNKSDGAILRDVHSYPGEKTGIVRDSFPAQGGITYLIKVIAFDASQNLGTSQVEVPVN